MGMKIRSLLVFLLSLTLLIGIFPCAIAEGTDEFVRAMELGFVSEEMAVDPDSAITWKQFCEMAGRMIEAIDSNALPAWQEMTANAPDTPMKRDGGMMSMLFVAKAVNLHTFNADYPNGGMADDLWAYATMDYPVFPFNEPIDLGEGVSCICHVGPAYDYCLRRASLVSGKRLLAWDENDSLRFADDFTVREAAKAILRLYESDESQLPVLSAATEPEAHQGINPWAEIEAGELERASAWGLVPAEWQESLDDAISHADFCALVRMFVERIKPERLSVWEEMANIAGSSDQIMARKDGAVGLFYAAEALECATSTAWDYPELEKISQHPYSWTDEETFPLWPGFDSEYAMYFAVPRTPEGTDFYYPPTYSLMNTAYNFTRLRLSSINGLPLMSYDAEYSMRLEDAFTRREAIVYLWRLVEGEPNLLEGNHYIPTEQVGAYDRSIITDELLSAPTDLPEVTHSRLPSEWSGFGLSQHKCRSIYSEFKESEFAFLEENGFNFVRIFFGFNYLRYPDYPEDANLINETELRDLDRMIAWGIQHGVHIQLSMSTTPNNLSTFEGMEQAEWDYLNAYWEALTRRYAGISSRYLTFDLANEMQAGYEVEPQEQALKLLEKMVNNIRTIDPDRVLLMSFNSNPGRIWMEGCARMGLSIGCHPYLPEILTSGSEDIFLKHVQNTWPYPYFPQGLNSGETLVIEGEIADQVLWINMWVYEPFRIVFDNGEKIECIPTEEQVESPFEWPIEIVIPENASRLEISPLKGRNLSFYQIGIQPGLDSEGTPPSQAGYLVPHDLLVRDSTGGAHLVWSYENGFTSERECSPEVVYEQRIHLQAQTAEKYNVGFMVNEMGSFAGGIGWDVHIKHDFDRDILVMLKEHGIAWAMCEMPGLLTQHFPGQAPPWENAEWQTKEYRFEDGRRETITYSPELLEMYKSFLWKPGDKTVVEVTNSVLYEESTVGSKGEHVQILQQALIDQGYLSGSADGIFGKKTAAAVQSAQADFGIEQTGVADEAFLRALYANR